MRSKVLANNYLRYNACSLLELFITMHNFKLLTSDLGDQIDGINLVLITVIGKFESFNNFFLSKYCCLKTKTANYNLRSIRMKGPAREKHVAD